MRILISGGTGFIGRHLAGHLERHGHHVEVISRRPHVGIDWDEDSLRRGIDRCDAVVHLAGAPVMDRRWDDAYKRQIEGSRVEGTARLAELCRAAERRLVSTSAVGYYGPGEMQRIFDEDAPRGEGFLAEVCGRWEAALGETPAAVVRVGVVLGPDGGALARLWLPFRLGLGGRVGSGDQPFPWIHIQDLVRLYTWLCLNPDRLGPFNGVAPGGCDQRTFVRALARAMGRPAHLPLPAPLLRAILGERACLLLEGQHVRPRRVEEQGFAFEHPAIEEACADLVSRRRRRPRNTFGAGRATPRI